MNQTTKSFIINLATGAIGGIVLVLAFTVILPALVRRSVYEALVVYYENNAITIYEEDNQEDITRATN